MAHGSQRTREDWEKAIGELNAGRQTRRSIAEAFGVAGQTVDYWRKKFGAQSRSPRLIAVSVQPERVSSERAGAELVFGEVAIRFTDRMPVQYIADLMRHLRAS